MLADRGQKSRALQYAVAREWLPQLELDVGTSVVTADKPFQITDIDLFALVPDDLGSRRAVLFDCKTRRNESPIARGLWQKGVMDYLSIERGICILKKGVITNDHRLAADQLGVSLLTEDEFEAYAKATAPQSSRIDAALADIDLWERFFAIGRSFPKLEQLKTFSKSDFWMLRSESEACRRTLYVLRALSGELDPDKPAHCALVTDATALFMIACSRLALRVFSGYLLPQTRDTLSKALLLILYGGKEAYEFRNEMVKRVLKKELGHPAVEEFTLALPEWDRFLKLMRQLLDAPLEAQYSPLILREIAFEQLAESSTVTSYLRQLGARRSQAARFALLGADYVLRSCKVPTEFLDRLSSRLYSALGGPKDTVTDTIRCDNRAFDQRAASRRDGQEGESLNKGVQVESQEAILKRRYDGTQAELGLTDPKTGSS